MRTVISLIACACVFAVACGGSGDGAAGAAAAGTGAGMTVTGGTGVMAGTGGAGGTGMVPPPPMMTVPMPMMPVDMPATGAGEENAPCMPGAMGACNASLSCATLPEPFTGVCGRSCATDADCTMEAEVCSAYSMADTQGICINTVPPWELYAFPETSACEPTSTPVSISQMDQPYGLCLELCMLPGTDPMDLPMDFPMEQLVTCGMGQECIDIGLTSDGATMAMPVLGACGVGVARGAVCDINMGQVCSDLADTCAPSDPNRLDGEQKCFQDCSEPGTTCAEGTCTPLMVMGMQVAAYCM